MMIVIDIVINCDGEGGEDGSGDRDGGGGGDNEE